MPHRTGIVIAARREPKAPCAPTFPCHGRARSTERESHDPSLIDVPRTDVNYLVDLKCDLEVRSIIVILAVVEIMRMVSR